MQRKKWSEEDTNNLKNYYPVYKNKTIAALLDRTPDSIAQKATRLGLLKKPKATTVEPKPEPKTEQTVEQKITILTKLLNLFKINK